MDAAVPYSQHLPRRGHGGLPRCAPAGLHGWRGRLRARRVVVWGEAGGVCQDPPCRGQQYLTRHRWPDVPALSQRRVREGRGGVGAATLPAPDFTPSARYGRRVALRESLECCAHTHVSHAACGPTGRGGQAARRAVAIPAARSAARAGGGPGPPVRRLRPGRARARGRRRLPAPGRSRSRTARAHSSSSEGRSHRGAAGPWICVRHWPGIAHPRAYGPLPGRANQY